MSDLVTRECSVLSRTQVLRAILSEKCQKLFTLFLTFLNLRCVPLSLSSVEFIPECE